MQPAWIVGALGVQEGSPADRLRCRAHVPFATYASYATLRGGGMAWHFGFDG